MIRVRPRPGISPSQLGCGVEHRGHDGRRRAHHGHAVLLDPPQDLGAVHLAQGDLRHAAAGHREGHAPAVGVEHRQRVEVDVAIGHAGVQRERHGVGPDVAVRDLHALGPGGRAGGVVDRGGGVLVGLPGARLDPLDEQVVVVAEHEHVLGLEIGEDLLELGIDVHDAGTRSARRCTAPRRRTAGSSPARAPGRSRTRPRRP